MSRKWAKCEATPGRSERSPIIASDDFALMLNARPGCHVSLGNAGKDGAGGVPVHNPRYDFNDEALVIGASYWARLAETALSQA